MNFFSRLSIASLVVAFSCAFVYGDSLDEYNQAKKFLGSEALYRFALEKNRRGRRRSGFGAGAEGHASLLAGFKGRSEGAAETRREFY